MYRRVLIANRSDCALRLIRACHEEGVEAYLICARDDLHTRFESEADGIIYTGMSRDAYVSQDDILEAALAWDCEAILPGWGFLSEDFGFARKCRLWGIDFVGPSTHHLQLFGDKLKTIQTLAPLLGLDAIAYRCDSAQLSTLLAPYPGVSWMLKPRFGGGGKGIERFSDSGSLLARLSGLSGVSRLQDFYVEPAIEGGRHIEFQLFGDGQGHVDVLGARDCSWQHGHQKWFEASVDMGADLLLCHLRDKIQKAFSSLQYLSWGTVEFLVHAGGVALLEVNPRLQVEHGVTEMQLCTDIVRRALRLSCLGAWGFERVEGDSVMREGQRCVEFRLYAKSTGTIERIGFEGYLWPHHAFESDADYRLESAYMPGERISGVYDGMLARFMVRSSSGEALGRLRSWLRTFHLEGLETNLEDLLGMDSL